MHRLLALVCLGLGLLLAVAAPPTAAQAPAGVVVLTVTGPITPVVAQYVDQGIGDAERAGARAVVLRLDTPGGLDTSMRAIIQRILTSRVPVITYVSPTGARAASAGAFISYAAHVAAMAPSTTIGSASPVSIGQDGQEQAQSETMKAKVTNDAVSYIRGLAERRGRNADWAERAVREAANLPASEALRQGVVDIVAVDMPDLLRQADGRSVQLERGEATLQTAAAATQARDPSPVEAFWGLIADPTVAYLLLALGMLGIYFELANPGSILPGVAGAIGLLLGLFGLGTLPVNWTGVLLMVLGFVLFAFDIFAPTHGVLTVGGIVAFLLGSLLLVNGDTTGGVLQVAPGAIAGVTLSMLGFSLFVSYVVVRDRRRRPATGGESLIGASGTVHTALAPSGMVFLEGERWQATSQGGPIAAGQTVRVIGRRGLELIVTASQKEPIL